MDARRGPADEISIVENVLRDLIEEVLSSRFGDDWLSQAGITSERLEIWEARRTEERKRREGGVPSDRLIYYADLTDLPAMLRKHWTLFTEAFGDLRTMEVYLSRLTTFRIAIMHGRALLPFEEHLVEGIAGEIRNKVVVWKSARTEEPEYFARIEQVVDSFGNVARPGQDANTNLVLHPGDQVQFRLSGWDPRGGQMKWLCLLAPGGATIAEQVGEQVGGEDLRWNIEGGHISDPATIVIYATGSTSYHRKGTYDDAVTFSYRVLPKV